MSCILLFFQVKISKTVLEYDEMSQTDFEKGDYRRVSRDCL